MSKEKMLEYDKLAEEHFELKKKYDREKDKEKGKYHKEQFEAKPCVFDKF